MIINDSYTTNSENEVQNLHADLRETDIPELPIIIGMRFGKKETIVF